MAVETFAPENAILVAESSAADLGALKKVLREFRFRNVAYAEDGYKALHAGRFSAFSLIFVASALEKTDGLQVLATLRAEGKNQKTPVVFLAGAGEEGLAEKAAAAGASAVAEKPLSAQPLREAVEGALGMKILTRAEEIESQRANLSATSSAVERGQQLLAQGDFEGAEAAFEEAMVTGGGSAEVFCGLAEVYLSRGEGEKADQVLAEAERIDPLAREKFRLRETAFVERGNEDLENGYFEDAKREFEGAIAANGESVAGHVGLGESLHGLGDEDGAKAAYDKALDIDEPPDDLHVYNWMGIAARRKKDYERALRAYDKALSFDEQDPVLYYNKSLVFVAQKEFEESLLLLKKALDLDPDFAQAKAARKTILDALSKS